MGNKRGRPQEVVSSLTFFTLTHFTTTVLDAADTVVATLDALGHAVRTVYDRLGRAVTTTTPFRP
jgi:YD repeat-containing protein